MFAVIFEDNLAADPHIRASLMPEHLAFLEAHADQVRAAGPLAENAGGPYGGLWLVQSDSEQDVERLIKKDPFWATDLRKSYRIFVWNQVFANGKHQAPPA
ncbi:MAG: YciI family protein [Pseudomonadota bacterium]